MTTGLTEHVDSVFRRHDWSLTPLRRVEHWSQSLKTTVSIVLGSRNPRFLWSAAQELCLAVHRVLHGR